MAEQLAGIYGNGRWIVAAQAAVSTRGICERLEGWGSEVLVVASNEGTGDLPEVPIVYTGSRGETILTSIRDFYTSVEKPDAKVQQAVDHFDPDRQAQVLAEPHATATTMVGRQTFGVRRPAWSAWEDKMRVDQLWHDLDIPGPAYRIVPNDAAPAAADALATELGTVWAADNSGGWHGGGELVRWVAGPEGYDSALEWLGPNTRRIRVMPFLDGLPCSIHGWVTSSGVAVFLPVEILILRHVGRTGFEYAGVATIWTAPLEVSEEMRDVGRRVGAHLARDVGYKGPYGVDGVVTTEGFRPTELNPRMSAGAGAQLGGVAIPLGLLMRAEIEGLVDVDHRWLEATAIEQRKPLFHFGKMVTEVVRDTIWIAIDDRGELGETDSELRSIGKVTAGPSATGSYIMGDFEVGKVTPGEPVGRLAAGSLNLVAAKWGLDLPLLTAAPNLVR